VALQKLLSKHAYELPDEEWTVFRELERRHGLLTKEEQHRDMIRDLRRKLVGGGGLTKQEVVRLVHLVEKYGVGLDDIEAASLAELRIRHGVQTQREVELAEYKALLEKL